MNLDKELRCLLDYANTSYLSNTYRLCSEMCVGNKTFVGSFGGLSNMVLLLEIKWSLTSYYWIVLLKVQR